MRFCKNFDENKMIIRNWVGSYIVKLLFYKHKQELKLSDYKDFRSGNVWVLSIYVTIAHEFLPHFKHKLKIMRGISSLPRGLQTCGPTQYLIKPNLT